MGQINGIKTQCKFIMFKLLKKKRFKICRLAKNNGFTLIEALAAVTVVAIGMFSVMTLIMMVMKSNQHSKKGTTAATLALDKIEDIKRMGYDDVLSTLSGENIEEYNTISGYEGYRRVTTIFTDTPVADMITGSITVYWSPGTHSVNLTTIVSK